MFQNVAFIGLGYKPEFFELFESNLNQMNRIIVLLIQYPRALIRQIQGHFFSNSVIHELALKRGVPDFSKIFGMLA